MATDAYYHVVAVRPGDRRKSVTNRSEDEVLAEFVIPFVSSGTIKASWGDSVHSYQALELRVYRTRTAFDRKVGKSLDQFLGKAKNLFPKFEDRAKKALGVGAYRVFVIMPIQGERFGSQDEQRIYKEYDERFEAIEKTLSEFDCVAIRIDKEHPPEDIVGTIKQEIRRAQFLVADLTDERPSCYFEAGYAEARGKPVVYVASEEQREHHQARRQDEHPLRHPHERPLLYQSPAVERQPSRRDRKEPGTTTDAARGDVNWCQVARSPTSR